MASEVRDMHGTPLKLSDSVQVVGHGANRWFLIVELSLHGKVTLELANGRTWNVDRARVSLKQI